MRRLGTMLYMTPLQRATESSTVPKSVMNTMVGGGCCGAEEDCCARTRLRASVKFRNNKPAVRIEIFARVKAIRIIGKSPLKTTILLGVRERPQRRASLLWRIYN